MYIMRSVIFWVIILLVIGCVHDTKSGDTGSIEIIDDNSIEGEKKMKIVRSTFLINKDGELEEALYAVDPDGHAQAMLDKVKAL